MTVIVKKIGGSVAVLIPKAIAREMELTDGTSLLISSSPTGGIILRRHGRRPRRSLRQIVSQIKPASYRRRNRELRDSKPVGKEIS